MRSAIVLCLLAALLAGCGGVILNAEYSALLDETASLSAETARRADANTLPAGDMKAALRKQASVWRQFKDARDGVAPSKGAGQ